MTKLHKLIMPVTIRMTWLENDTLKKSASKSNLTMSDYIRQFVPELNPRKGNK
jgi:hypothetical protein